MSESRPHDATAPALTRAAKVRSSVALATLVLLTSWAAHEGRRAIPSRDPATIADRAAAQEERPEPRASVDGVPLEGRVRTLAGEPVADARVRLTPEEGGDTIELTSGADGAFAAEGVAPGRWIIRATAPLLSEASTVRAVPLGAPLELVLAPVGRIAGRVLGADGLPAQGVELLLAGSGVWPPRSVRSDERGEFVFPDVPPGVYEVDPRSAAGAADARRGISVEPGSRAYLTFSLGAGETLAGRVVDDVSGAAVQGAEISVVEGGLGVAPRALESGPDGSFRATGLRHAVHAITVRASGYVPVLARTWEPGTPLEIRLRRGAILSGVVLDAERNAVAGAELEIVGETAERDPIALSGHSGALRASSISIDPRGSLGVTDEVPPIPLDGPPIGIDEASLDGDPERAPVQQLLSYRTREDGTFELFDVPPGHVQVIAHAAGYATATSERLWVEAGGRRDGVEIVLPRGGRVEGSVHDERGEGVADVLVEVRGEHDAWARTAFTDEDGRFAVADVLGPTLVRALPSDRPAALARIDVDPGATVSTTLTLDPASLVLRGRTVDARGFPIGGVILRLEALRPGEPSVRTAVSGDDGTFEIDRVPAPPLRLLADHAAHAIARPLDVSSLDAEVSVVLDEGETVRGTLVREDDGLPIEGASIVLVSDAVPPVVRSVETDAEGAYVIPRAATGAYAMHISAPALVPVTRELSVVHTRGAETELDPIALGAGVRIEGDVVDRGGSVVADAEVSLDDDWSTAVRTDANGHFVIAAAPARDAVVRARHPAIAGAIAEGRVEVIAGRDPSAVILRVPGRYSAERAVATDAIERGVPVLLDAEGRILALRGSGRALRSGVRVGDVVLGVDGASIEGDPRRALRGPVGAEALVRLRRGETEFVVRLPRERWTLR